MEGFQELQKSMIALWGKDAETAIAIAKQMIDSAVKAGLLNGIDLERLQHNLAIALLP